jgi:cytochrome P450
MAESQLMVVIATLLRHFEFALPSPDYRVEIQAAPIPNPGKGLTVKVVRRRG